MRTLLLLLRYAGLTVRPLTVDSKMSGRGRVLPPTLFVWLLLSIVLFPAVLFVYFVSYRLYSSLARFTNVLLLDLAKYFHNTNMSVFSLFYVVGFVGTGVNAFTRSDETELLLTLPLKRTVIVTYNLLRTTVGQVFTILLFVGTTLGYMRGAGLGAWPFLIHLALHIAFVTMLGATLAVSLGGTVVRRVARHVSVLTMIGMLFVYLALIFVLRLDLESLGGNQTLVRWLQFTNSRYNPFIWSFFDEPPYRVLVLVVTVALALFFWYHASLVWFEGSLTRTQRTSNEPPVRRSPFRFSPILVKDLKLFVRDEQFLFLVLYPFAFAIFTFLVSNRSWAVTMTSFLSLSSFYASIEAAVITVNEKKHGYVGSTLPLSEKAILLPKIFIPTSLNIALLLILLLTLTALSGFQARAFVYAPVSLLLFAVSANIGVYYGTTRPGKSRNQPIDIFSVLVIQLLTFLLSATLVFPISNVLFGTWVLFFRLRTINQWILYFGVGLTIMLGSIYGTKVVKIWTRK